MKILIIKQTSLGDLLHSTIAIDAIKRKYPYAKITYLVDISTYEIIKYNPSVDNFILFQFNMIMQLIKKNPFKVIKYFYDKIEEVRKEEYDIAFDLQGLERSVIFLYFARAREKYVKGRYLFLKGFRNKNLHAIDEISKVLNLANIPTENIQMNLFIPETINEKVKNLLQSINPDNKKILVISPFTRWETKNWGLAKFKELIVLLKQKDYIIILTGTKEYEKELDNLIEDFEQNKIFNFSGKLSILEFCALINNCNLLLSCESFPVHLASALHKKVIVLMGPTDERKIGPVNTEFRLIRAEKVNCQRCYRKKCKKMDCMKRIDAETVYKNIVEMI